MAQCGADDDENVHAHCHVCCENETRDDFGTPPHGARAAHDARGGDDDGHGHDAGDALGRHPPVTYANVLNAIQTTDAHTSERD